MREDNIRLKPQCKAISTVSVFLWKSRMDRLSCVSDRAWHRRCLSSIRSNPNERTGQPAILEHENQDRDPDPGDLRGAVLIDGRAGGVAPRLGADAKDLKTVGKRLKSVFQTDL